MKKNNYISAILLFVFSLVLIHDIIPHHHDEISRIEITEHNHSHDHDKKEHNHRNENQDHHNGNGNSIGLFSHLSHILASTKIVISDDNNFQKTQCADQFFMTSNLVVRSIVVPVRLKPPNYISTTYLQRFYSKRFLRGPPMFAV